MWCYNKQEVIKGIVSFVKGYKIVWVKGYLVDSGRRFVDIREA
jgi:hypothetical protein